MLPDFVFGPYKYLPAFVGAAYHAARPLRAFPTVSFDFIRRRTILFMSLAVKTLLYLNILDFPALICYIYKMFLIKIELKSKEGKMFKKIQMFLFFAVVLCLTSAIYADGAPATHVGGQLKIGLFDYSSGTSNGATGSESRGFTIGDIWIYISQDLTDWFSVDVEPQFACDTGATPSIGNPINSKMSKFDVTPSFDGWSRLLAKASLPGGVDLSFGVLRPRFTLDYGTELFFEDEFNAGQFTHSPFLGEMHESGLEILKSFSVSSVSIPVFLYIMNGAIDTGGSAYLDNNNQPTVMLHAEPELGPVKLTGSIALGKWDDKEINNLMRYSFGVMLDFGDLTIRSEAAGAVLQKALSSGDAKAYGYYFKAGYRPSFAKWFRLTFQQNLADHNFTGFDNIASGTTGERYLTNSPGFELYILDSAILQFAVDIADWRTYDNTNISQFVRPTLGCRITY